MPSFAMKGGLAEVGRTIQQIGKEESDRGWQAYRDQVNYQREQNLLRLRNQLGIEGKRAELEMGLEFAEKGLPIEMEKARGLADIKQRHEGELGIDPATGEMSRFVGTTATPITTPAGKPYKGQIAGKSASQLPERAKLIEYFMASGDARTRKEAINMANRAARSPYEAQKIATQMTERELDRYEDVATPLEQRRTPDEIYQHWLDIIQGRRPAGSTETPRPASATKPDEFGFIPGQWYQDAEGNMDRYLGNNKWAGHAGR